MSDLPRPDQLPPGPDAARARHEWSVRLQGRAKLWHFGAAGRRKSSRSHAWRVEDFKANGDQTLPKGQGQLMMTTEGLARVVKARRPRRDKLVERQEQLEKEMAELRAQLGRAG